MSDETSTTRSSEPDLTDPDRGEAIAPLDRRDPADAETPASSAGDADTAAADQLDDIEDLDELEFLLEEIESKIAPLALIVQI